MSMAVLKLSTKVSGYFIRVMKILQTLLESVKVQECMYHFTVLVIVVFTN